METLDKKRRLELGRWLEQFLDPNIENFEYSKMARSAIGLLDVNYVFQKNDISKILIDYITKTEEWKKVCKYNKNQSYCYDWLFLWESLDDWMDDIAELITNEFSLHEPLWDNENAKFWLNEFLEEICFVLSYKVYDIPLIMDGVLESKKKKKRDQYF